MAASEQNKPWDMIRFEYPVPRTGRASRASIRALRSPRSADFSQQEGKSDDDQEAVEDSPWGESLEREDDLHGHHMAGRRFKH